MLNTHTHVYTQAHTWACIFDFYCSPVKWLYDYSHLAGWVSLSFKICLSISLPCKSFVNDSHLLHQLCFLPPVAPLYPMWLFHTHIAHSEVPSVCFSYISSLEMDSVSLMRASLQCLAEILAQGTRQTKVCWTNSINMREKKKEI